MWLDKIDGLIEISRFYCFFCGESYPLNLEEGIISCSLLLSVSLFLWQSEFNSWCWTQESSFEPLLLVTWDPTLTGGTFDFTKLKVWHNKVKWKKKKTLMQIDMSIIDEGYRWLNSPIRVNPAYCKVHTNLKLVGAYQQILNKGLSCWQIWLGLQASKDTSLGEGGGNVAVSLFTVIRSKQGSASA